MDTHVRAYDLNHDWISSRVTTITGAATPIKASFVSTRDTFGRVTQTAKTGEIYNRYGNGNDALNTNYGYNDRSEITADQTTVGSTGAVLTGRNDSHVYDSIGNRSTVSHNGNGAGYTVNNLNQYVSRTVPGTFDVAGAAQTNFTVTVNGSSSGVSRSGNYYFKGQPLTNTGAAVSASIPISDGSAVGSLTAFLAGTPEAMVYDLDGNLTTDGRWDYGYDAENRLNWMATRDVAVSTLVPKVAMQILYDYLGRRIWKISYTWNIASSSWNVAHHEMFIYNGWNLVAEINGGTGAITKNFLWGIDLSGTAQGAGGVGGLLMTQDGGQSYLPMYDVTPTTPVTPVTPPPTPINPNIPTIGPYTPSAPAPGIPVTPGTVGAVILNAAAQTLGGFSTFGLNTIYGQDNSNVRAYSAGAGIINDGIAQGAGIDPNDPGFALATSMTQMAGGFALGGAGAFTAADGSLFGSMRMSLPFDFPVGRWGLPSGRYWAPRFISNPTLSKMFSALHPRFQTDMGIYTRGVIPAGTTFEFGITGPQPPFYKYPGANVQFRIPGINVINKNSRF